MITFFLFLLVYANLSWQNYLATFIFIRAYIR